MDLGKFLIAIGVTPNTSGFYYLLEAIEIYIKNPNSKITQVQRNIAKEHKVTQTSVEKSMRHALSLVNTNCETYKEYVPITRRDLSVSEFVSIIAYLIKGGGSKKK